VVGGGYHATLCPAEAAEHFDAIVAGGAEGAWPRLIADLLQHRLEKIYRAEPGPSLGSPMPRRDLLGSHARHYITINGLETGRGCEHGCRYCSVAVFHGRRHRKRPLGEVLADIKAVPRDLIFVDDNIITDREYARALFGSLIPLGKRWVGQSSIEIAEDPDLLERAAASGCCGLFLGIETTSPRNLAAMDKEFNSSSSCLERISRIRASGIGVTAGMIVGLDDDGVDVFRQTLDFLLRARIDAVQLNILTPLPGTPLFAQMEAAGRIIDRDWSHYDFRHVVFRPERMTAGQLQAGADWIYSQFYRADRILGRFVRSLVRLRWCSAYLCLRLGLTYRYDNRKQRIAGRNPAADLTRVHDEAPVLDPHVPDSGRQPEFLAVLGRLEKTVRDAVKRRRQKRQRADLSARGLKPEIAVAHGDLAVELKR